MIFFVVFHSVCSNCCQVEMVLVGNLVADHRVRVQLVTMMHPWNLVSVTKSSKCDVSLPENHDASMEI